MTDKTEAPCAPTPRDLQREIERLNAIITTAACANWHRALFGRTNMRPGIKEATNV